MATLHFQGGYQLSKVPEQPGLYAWYYKPLVADPTAIARVFSALVTGSAEMQAEVRMRYGVRLSARAGLAVKYGAIGQSPEEIFQGALDTAADFVQSFFQTDAAQLFARPIYIGIAKNLRTRVFEQHYSLLTDYWQDSSSVSQYLAKHGPKSIDEVSESLHLNHSFALEARVHEIPTRDLMVYVYPMEIKAEIGSDTDDPSTAGARRALERVLQLTADPFLGRR
jgi:hypothetical protein